MIKLVTGLIGWSLLAGMTACSVFGTPSETPAAEKKRILSHTQEMVETRTVIVCLGGYNYYFYWSGYNSGLAPQVSDNGYVKCDR